MTKSRGAGQERRPAKILADAQLTLPDLTGLDKPGRATVVHDLIQKMKTDVGQIDMAYMRIGAILSFIQKAGLYRDYGVHIRSMRDFMVDIDLGVTVAQGNHYVRLYRLFGEHIGEKRITMGRLLICAPLVKTKQDAVNWMQKAEDLPMEALKDEVREAKGLTPTDACGHPPDRLERWFRCSVCKKWLKDGNPH